MQATYCEKVPVDEDSRAWWGWCYYDNLLHRPVGVNAVAVSVNGQEDVGGKVRWPCQTQLVQCFASLCINLRKRAGYHAMDPPTYGSAVTFTTSNYM